MPEIPPPVEDAVKAVTAGTDVRHVLFIGLMGGIAALCKYIYGDKPLQVRRIIGEVSMATLIACVVAAMLDQRGIRGSSDGSQIYYDIMIAVPSGFFFNALLMAGESKLRQWLTRNKEADPK